MNTPSPRPRALTVPIVLGLLFGGGYVGTQLANLVAPDSGLAEFISFFALPVSLTFGIIGWLGAASVRVLRMRRRAARAGKDSRTVTEPFATGSIFPPGSFAFVPAALIPCALAGVVVGLLSSHFGFIAVLGSYLLLGLGYGLSCWKLAQHGYLPFPEE